MNLLTTNELLNLTQRRYTFQFIVSWCVEPEPGAEVCLALIERLSVEHLPANVCLSYA